MTLSTDYYLADLAFIHHTGFDNPARHAAASLLSELQQRKINHGKVVDLGCGSGILARIVSEAGFEVLGVDYSPQLIHIARDQAPKAQFWVGSLFDANIPPCIAVTSIGECLNYQFDPSNSLDMLRSLFARVYERLLPGGLLLFDIVEPGLHAPVYASSRIIEQENWTLFLDYLEDRDSHLLTRNITIFRKLEDGHYRKSKEIHRLQLYPREIIANILEATGFEVSTMDAYGGLKLREKNVVFLASKKQEGGLGIRD